MRWIASRWVIIAWLVGIACASGCQSVSIKKVGRSQAPAYRTALSQPSGFPTPQPDPLPTSSESTSLDPLPNSNVGSPNVLLAHAEASRRSGVQAAAASGEVATRFELIALTEATEAIVAAHAEPSSRVDEAKVPEARAVYAASLRDFLRDSSGKDVQLNQKWTGKLASQGVRVQFDREASTWTPDQFDEFYFAEDFKIEGLAHQYKHEGVGVPLVGIRRFRLGELGTKTGEEKFLMPTQMYPVTAVLKLRGRGNQGDGVELASLRQKEPTARVAIPPAPTAEYVLELHDPIVERKIEFEGRSEPLAGDLTTSMTYHFVHSPFPILQEIGLLDPQWLEKLAGLYMVHPLHPGADSRDLRSWASVEPGSVAQGDERDPGRP